MYDLIIKNGTVYDGTGEKPFFADVAIKGNKIVAIGELEESSKEVIDAKGKIVAPGFVDIHTHYDGQVTWDPYLRPSTYHGVTTVVMGNCGVGFSPCKPEERDWLISLMEGVEDIPGTALHEGINWQWESFPEYLDTLEGKPLAIDVGTQIPHGAVRAYVMGQRGIDREEASQEEIEQMSQIVKEAIEAGAFGFSTSRTEKHKDSSGALTPSITAHKNELVSIAKSLGEIKSGVLQGISDFYDFETEFNIFKEMSESSGRPISITVEQMDQRPDWWHQLLDGIEEAQGEGINMYGQVPPRATGINMGLTATLNPFTFYPSFYELSKQSLEEKVAAMKDPAFKEKLLSEDPVSIGNPLVDEITQSFNKMFRLGEPANYEPEPDASFEAIAKKQNISPQEVAYDCLLEKEGKALIYHPLFNYLPGNLDYVERMLNHPYSISGLGDAGAHCGAISDASFPTTLIQHWGRDRKRGKKIPLEKLISMQTLETSRLLGITDRGVLKEGYKADINVIDFENLTLHEPEVLHDLPAGGRRLVQRASGYEYTIVSGQIAFKDGESTGALNGRLIRNQVS
ncbi:MAG: amidohydrolase [Gammaproteobacteria bacterium]|jgi:N-acyl-D-aspartate/D-glutamate deacylase|nr:amidohydrolase family protein [SAR86 cluster bacterium]GIT61372.1 MAG: amidohydrolase [Gammaproteobacteria bacterium]|tara:strand:- start:481 stop:2190 length:1710 start_codon:yes stop_codon:yes gene_type:complete